MERIEKETGLKAGECNDTIDLDYCACLDACEQAPNVGIDNNIIHEAEEDTIMEEIERGGVPIETQEIDIDQLFYKDIIQ
jgi:NADH:ubiquinone oxidoreductase subunit E